MYGRRDSRPITGTPLQTMSPGMEIPRASSQTSTPFPITCRNSSSASPCRLCREVASSVCVYKHSNTNSVYVTPLCHSNSFTACVMLQLKVYTYYYFTKNIVSRYRKIHPMKYYIYIYIIYIIILMCFSTTGECTINSNNKVKHFKFKPKNLVKVNC